MTSTRISRRMNAPRARVYRALLDARDVETWMVPDGMTSHVHEFDAREGGAFRVSLTYDSPAAAGKSTAHTDTYHGRFEELIPNQRVVERLEFETTDPLMQGEMRIITELSAVRGGTCVTVVHEHLPPGVRPADNDAGWQESLAKLAALLKSAP